MNRRIMVGTIVALAGVCAAPAAAQQPDAAPVPPPLRAMVLPAMAADVQPGDATLRIAAVESRVTTGRPYSAEATTEFVHVLGDGNRIVRKTTVRIYRDGEGRTRRDEVAADGTVKSISIYDPTDHVSFLLDPATRTAQKAVVRMVLPQPMAAKVQVEREASARVAGKIAVAPVELPAAAAAEEVRKRMTEVVVRAGGGGAVGAGAAVKDAKTESLGQRTIDGLPADGTRTVVVIPAGSIGNQQAITVMSEQWFSPDLEILLSTKHTDPRSGETTYSLSNIVRGEPAAGTFDVPADYTINESRYRRTPLRQ